MRMIQGMSADNDTLTPAGAISQTPFVRLAGQMILGGNSGFMSE
jgi:hypothetical protein